MSATRSLADDLRQREDRSLAALLSRRPDLLNPVPSDLTALANRATTGPSVARCLDTLDAPQLFVLRIAAEQTTTSGATDEAIIQAVVAELGPTARSQTQEAIANLVDLALVWGGPLDRHAVHATRALTAQARPPTLPAPQLVEVSHRAVDAIDAEAALGAREFLGQVRDLLDEWSIDPPLILRSGGLSLRDFAAARDLLHSDWRRASTVIEVAHAARLLAADEADAHHWAPTDHYDAWLRRGHAEQWLELVHGWMTMQRLPSLADQKTQVLSGQTDRRVVPALRASVLATLANATPGAEIQADSLIRVLDEQRPRRGGALREQTIQAVMFEGHALGVLSSGAMTTSARLLLGSRSPATARAADNAVIAALNASLPDDVDYVLIQADFTVVAPGPLDETLGRSLRVVADIESRGHATVYRISEHSIRRALDCGWDAQAIHTLLASASRTGVPQPLTYLVDDVARRFGALRVGGAHGYVRCDSSQTVAAIMADRRLRQLGLVRIADTVLIAQAPPAHIVDELRRAGYFPAAEASDGQLVIRRPDDHRTRTPRAPKRASRPIAEDTLVAAAVRSLRAGERALRPGHAVPGPAASTDLQRLTSTKIVSILRESIADSRPVWIGYSDTDGALTTQIVDPIRLTAGVLTAFDHRTEQVRTFAVSRVTGIAEAIDTGA